VLESIKIVKKSRQQIESSVVVTDEVFPVDIDERTVIGQWRQWTAVQHSQSPWRRTVVSRRTD